LKGQIKKDASLQGFAKQSQNYLGLSEILKSAFIASGLLHAQSGIRNDASCWCRFFFCFFSLS
jgi:hypothetical protein